MQRGFTYAFLPAGFSSSACAFLRLSFIPSPGLMAAKRRAFLGRQHRNFMRAARFCLPRMQSADGVLDSRYARVQLRHVAGALVGTQQVTTLHVRKPWAALAIVPDRTCRADRQLRFAN